MTTKYLVETFSDIIAAVREELGEDSSDTTVTNRIKRDINHVYLQEVAPEANWWWLTRSVEVQAKAYFNTGTCTVTANSCTVTLTETPAVSYRGYFFATDGYNEVYRIAQHSANSATLTLESPYSGTGGSSKSFKIWQEAIALPVDASRALEIRHDFDGKPLIGVGRQEFRRIVAKAPRAAGRPEFYCTGSLVDPQPYDSIGSLPATTYRSSSGLTRSIVFASTLGASEATALIAPGDRIEVQGAGHYSYNGEWVVSELTTTTVTNDTIKFTVEESKQESSTADSGITVKKAAVADKQARYRELLLYPSIHDANTTLKVDYLVEPQPLVDDSDEPLIPLEDRNVLVYGVLCRQWVKHRDEETAVRNERLFKEKLSKMVGRVEESMDLPKIEISRQYLRGKRRTGRGYGITGPASLGFASGGGASAISGTANRVAVFDSNGRLASDTNVSTTELGYLDNVTSNIQTQINSANSDLAAHLADTADAHDASAISVSPSGNLAADDVQEALLELQTDIDTINTLADGKIYVGNGSNVATEVTPSGDVTISNAGVTAISSGVIVNADVNASAAIAHSKMAALTASRAMVTDGSGVASASSVTSTELGYVSGVTSALQTQIDGKQTTTLASGKILVGNGSNVAAAVTPAGDVTIATDGTTAISGGVIVDADVSVAADITRSKLAPGNGYRILANDASGEVSENAALTASRNVRSDANGQLTTGAVTLSDSNDVTGTLPIANGGTGQTGATAAFDALAPTTTTGDMIYYNGSDNARLAIGSSGQVLKTVGGVPTWATFSGGINYLSSNPDAESDTTGWATYADAAGSSPVDGTAGSPTVTWTRTTSTPLRGSGSFLFTKDAANRQGEGASFAFSVDTADKARLISISFDYAIASGTYATGDLTVYIYDVTNSTVIQPAGYQIYSATQDLPCKHIATFQTASNSTSYRLILHVASTSASAYTVKFDNFSVGPQTVQYGAPVTDAQQYTPTFAGVGTATAIDVTKARVGDSVIISGRFTTGTAAASVASLTLPSGLSLDTTKKTSSAFVVGRWYRDSASATTRKAGTVIMLAASPTLLQFASDDYTAAATPVTTALNGSTVFGNNEVISFYTYPIPISGWSSSVSMSGADSSDGRVVALTAVKTSGSQTSSASEQDVAWDSGYTDSHGAFDGTTYTVAVEGWYEIIANVAFQYHATGVRYCAIYLDGSLNQYSDVVTPSSSSATHTKATKLLKLTAGQTIKIKAYQSSGGNLAYVASGGSSLSIKRLSGNNAVMPAETVAAKAYGGTTTIGTGDTTMVFTTKKYDTHGTYNTSTGEYTIPIAGKYDVKALVTSNNATGSAGNSFLSVYVDGSRVSYMATTYNATGASAFTCGSTTISVTAGQVVTVRAAFPASLAAYNNEQSTWFSIERVGN